MLQQFESQFSTILNEVYPVPTVDARVKASLMGAMEAPTPFYFLRKPANG